MIDNIVEEDSLDFEEDADIEAEVLEQKQKKDSKELIIEVTDENIH